MSLSGKVALVTGASTGIGRAVALRLAADGATVVASYGSDAAGAKEVVDQIGSDRALAVQADSRSPESLEKLVGDAIAKFGKIDILVAAAGVMPTVPLAGLTSDGFDDVFNINVKAPLLLCQKAAPHMPAGSHIVLFSTTLCAASTVMPHYLLYVASKGAIEQATRVLAKDLGKKDISVNCVAPGPTSSRGFHANQTDLSLKMAAGATPSGRLGQPDDIADAVAFLCGDNSRWVAGQTIRVNGGMA
ncbi:hypothetical protein B0T24DRAFT_633125 [Lasiosphaeria ovina]|uniref:NAD(P)-binding protein n=1 Tax=Lasiosphaeria ovina TaxID=92902 RepID=A0AAE0K4Y7_9PEZI|nr:hypothetical protein B0T24DRAFT_633125 [Lasiosphaeria ovina]